MILFSRNFVIAKFRRIKPLLKISNLQYNKYQNLCYNELCFKGTVPLKMREGILMRKITRNVQNIQPVQFAQVPYFACLS